MSSCVLIPLLAPFFGSSNTSVKRRLTAFFSAQPHGTFNRNNMALLYFDLSLICSHSKTQYIAIENTLLTKGKYDEAEPHASSIVLRWQILILIEESLGECHPCRILLIYETSRRFWRGMSEQVCCLLVHRLLLYITHHMHRSWTDRHIGACSTCLLQGKYEEAKALYRRAMVITGETLGMEHPSYSVELRSLANLLQGQVRGRLSSPRATMLSYGPPRAATHDDTLTSPPAQRICPHRVSTTRPRFSIVERSP